MVSGDIVMHWRPEPTGVMCGTLLVEQKKPRAKLRFQDRQKYKIYRNGQYRCHGRVRATDISKPEL